MSPKKTKGLINQPNRRAQSELLTKEGISKTPCLSPTAENGLGHGGGGGGGVGSSAAGSSWTSWWKGLGIMEGPWQ